MREAGWSTMTNSSPMIALVESEKRRASPNRYLRVGKVGVHLVNPSQRSDERDRLPQAGLFPILSKGMPGFPIDRRILT